MSRRGSQGTGSPAIRTLSYAVGFTPDGAQIAAMPGHGDQVQSLALAPDGTIVSGDWSGEIRLWDGGTGAFRRTLARQDTGVGSLSVSPDGKTLLSGTGYQGPGNDCHVYDLASGREIVTYSGHYDIVLATPISPDGRWAATGEATTTKSTSGISGLASAASARMARL